MDFIWVSDAPRAFPKWLEYLKISIKEIYEAIFAVARNVNLEIFIFKTAVVVPIGTGPTYPTVMGELTDAD